MLLFLLLKIARGVNDLNYHDGQETQEVKGPGGRVRRLVAFDALKSGIHTLFVYKEYWGVF